MVFFRDHPDYFRHLSFAFVGGFIASYSVIWRGMLSNAQTLNLLERVIGALDGDRTLVLLHLGSFFLYGLGTILTVLLPRYLCLSPRRACPVIDAAAVVALAVMPERTPPVAALYPVVFAMSFQWSAFTGAGGCTSSTIFSTNNTKQLFLSLGRFITTGDRKEGRVMGLFGSTLLAFHLGVASAWLAVRALGRTGILCLFPVLILCWALVRAEDRLLTAA